MISRVFWGAGLITGLISKHNVVLNEGRNISTSNINNIFFSGFRRNASKIQVYGDEFNGPKKTIEVPAAGHFQFFNTHRKIENEEGFGRKH